MLFIEYPRCSTCQKAKKWLDANGAIYTDRHIKDDRPTVEELTEWYHRSGLPLRKFFNTSGIQYRALNLKERLPEMSEREQLELLASDGMLIRRPLLIGADFVLTGFRESEWQAALLR